MKKLLMSAAAATVLITGFPAFAASPADDAEWGRSPYPDPGHCRFVNERIHTQDGRIVLQREQVCQ
jgi:hypothetical protein